MTDSGDVTGYDLPDFQFTETEVGDTPAPESPFGSVDSDSMNERFMPVPMDEMSGGYLDVDPGELERANSALFRTGVKDAATLQGEVMVVAPSATEASPFVAAEAPAAAAPAELVDATETAPQAYEQEWGVEEQAVPAASSARDRFAAPPQGPSPTAGALVSHGVTSMEADLILHGPPVAKKRGLFRRK